MKTTFHVLRDGVAAGLCLAVLAACDGRATTPFKSYRDTPEQYAARQKAQRELEQQRQKQDPKGAVTDPEPSVQGPPSPPAPLPQAPAPTSPAPSAPAGDPPVDTGGAERKSLEEAAAKSGRLKELRDLVDKELLGGVNPAAAAAVNEITVEAVGTPASFSAKAALTVQGQKLFLKVEPQVFGFDSSGEVKPLSFSLFSDREMKSEALGAGAEAPLKIFAYCPSSDCNLAHVLLQIAGENNTPVNAAFMLQKKGERFELMNSNLPAEQKSFADSEPGTAAGPKGSREQAPPAGGETQVTKTAPAAPVIPATPIPAAPAKPAAPTPAAPADAPTIAGSAPSDIAPSSANIFAIMNAATDAEMRRARGESEPKFKLQPPTPNSSSVVFSKAAPTAVPPKATPEPPESLVRVKKSSPAGFALPSMNKAQETQVVPAKPPGSDDDKDKAKTQELMRKAMDANAAAGLPI